MRDLIEEGDLVSVNFNGSKHTLSVKAIVHNVPCQTGDSWIVEDLATYQIHYVSEGCTVTFLKKKNEI